MNKDSADMSYTLLNSRTYISAVFYYIIKIKEDFFNFKNLLFIYCLNKYFN